MRSKPGNPMLILLPSVAHILYDMANLTFAYTHNASDAYLMSPATKASITAVSFR